MAYVTLYFNKVPWYKNTLAPNFPITCALQQLALRLTSNTELGLVTLEWVEQEEEVDADDEERNDDKNAPSSTFC